MTEHGEVLAKAVTRAGERLGLAKDEICLVIGQEPNRSLLPGSKAGGRAIMLIKIARRLDALVGADQRWIEAYMRNPNKMTGGTPAEQIKTADGLSDVLVALGRMEY